MSVRRHLAHVGANLCAFNTGIAVTNLRVAVTQRVQDKDGTWRDGETSFHRVNVWRDLATNLTDSLSKGDRAVVIGWLKSRSWETPEGDQRSVIEIEADEIAPSLKWATAKPERVSRNGDSEAKPAGEFADEPAF
jgi:single-strand DNA-binding protein